MFVPFTDQIPTNEVMPLEDRPHQIGELADSGKLKEMQMKWFGFEMKTPSEGYLPPGAL